MSLPWHKCITAQFLFNSFFCSKIETISVLTFFTLVTERAAFSQLALVCARHGMKSPTYNHGLFYRLLARHSLEQTWTLKDPLSWVLKWHLTSLPGLQNAPARHTPVWKKWTKLHPIAEAVTTKQQPSSQGEFFLESNFSAHRLIKHSKGASVAHVQCLKY